MAARFGTANLRRSEATWQATVQVSHPKSRAISGLVFPVQMAQATWISRGLRRVRDAGKAVDLLQGEQDALVIRMVCDLAHREWRSSRESADFAKKGTNFIHREDTRRTAGRLNDCAMACHCHPIPKIARFGRLTPGEGAVSREGRPNFRPETPVSPQESRIPLSESPISRPESRIPLPESPTFLPENRISPGRNAALPPGSCISHPENPASRQESKSPLP